MQRFLGTTAAMFAWASSALAVRLQMDHIVQTPGAHLQNLAGESFDMNQQGEHVLLRAPPETTKHALLRVSGTFKARAAAPCDVYAEMLTLTGDWLGNLTLRMSMLNGSLHLKVSSKSPAYAGPWRSILNYTPATHGHEAIPDTFKIMKGADGTRVTLYGGKAELAKRPMVKVKNGLRGGLDVSLSNLQGFDSPRVGGLLGSFKHNTTAVEETSADCKASSDAMRKVASAAVDHVEAALAVESTHLRNLLHEKFTMNQAGAFPLLRVPKAPEVPAFITVKGSFVSTSDEPCVVFLQRLTLGGTWFGNKTIHVSSQDETLNVKISMPKYAGKLQKIKDFSERMNGPEALPRTAKLTSLLDGPSFKFQLGPGKLSNRANIDVTYTKHGGLDIKVSHLERTKEAVIGGLLGTDKYPKSLQTPLPDCKGKAPPPVKAEPSIELPAAGGGSLLTASWTP